MTPALSPEAAASLRTYIDNATMGDKPEFPGAVVHIVAANNESVFSHASGGSIPLSKDTLVTGHSLTKIIGAIAFMQLVDRRLVSLDDSSVVEKLLPELAAQKVLTGSKEREDGTKEWILEDRRGDITPRMLLNRTYGGGHTYFNTLLHGFFQHKGIWATTNEIADIYNTLLTSPLLWQPGTHTNYGQGLDWIAIVIERLTNQSLKDYFQDNIFDPLHLARIGFEEQYGGDTTSRPPNNGTFWPRSLKTSDGTYTPMDPPVLSATEKPPSWPEGPYHRYPLGTGLVSSAADFTRILTLLLPSNNGVDPTTKQRLVSPESVREITSPQLPEHIRDDTRNTPSSLPAMFQPGFVQSPHMDPHGSFGFGCGVQGSRRELLGGKMGRGKGSVYWYGAANTEYWVDMEGGIVVFVGANYFPWMVEGWVRFLGEVEGMVYAGLEGRREGGGGE